jgi:hypothetical protein
MAKAKAKAFTVTVDPPASHKGELQVRGEGEERTKTRVYSIAAADENEARSLVEERERLIAQEHEQEPWKVSGVEAS